MKVLLAEDDKNLGKLLTSLLKKQHIDVNWVEDGEAAYNTVYTDGFDVLILDWMMPRLSGLELTKRLREEAYEGKILLLTAKDSISDKVTGLNMGADDYLVKPFEMAELVARLNALCRRHGVYTTPKITYGEYTLESSTYSLYYRGMRVELRAREFKVLELLLTNVGQVLPRDLILDRVWGLDNDITENNLDVHIRLIRKKIFSLSGEEIIKTVRGVGYYVE